MPAKKVKSIHKTYFDLVLRTGEGAAGGGVGERGGEGVGERGGEGEWE